MTTDRQIAANRQNAQQSTGPRTPQGKAKASRNNTRHALYSYHDALIPTIPADLPEPPDNDPVPDLLPCPAAPRPTAPLDFAADASRLPLSAPERGSGGEVNPVESNPIPLLSPSAQHAPAQLQPTPAHPDRTVAH